MNAVMEKNYPLPMWKPTLPVNDKPQNGPLNPAYAHNKKQEQAMEEDGYTDQNRSLKFEYPFSMYDGQGNIKTATDAAHKAELIAAGYSETPVAKKVRAVREAPAPGSAAAAMSTVPQDDSRVEALEDEVAALRETVEGIKADSAQSMTLLQQILENQTKPVGKGKKNEDSAA